ncbi:MAG TPA: histidinol-phosphate transaminase [Aquiluna sp.]
MSSLDKLPIRSDLRGLEPYGAPQLDVPVQLNVNENTFGIPESVAISIVEKVAQATIGLNRYPDREFMGLRSALAQYLGQGLAPEQIWAANGSNEILQQFFTAFGGPERKALSFGPTYSMYPNIARGTLTNYSERPREAGFELSPQYLAAEIQREKPDIVILCTPNNPTGNSISLEAITAAYDAFDGMLLIDEAYQEFSSRESAISLLPSRERLVVSRTMSKAFAFAGARLGYMASDASVVDAMRLVRLPYHLSSLTQAASLAAIEHASDLLATVDQIKVQRDRISAAAVDFGLTVQPSDANFVLVSGIEDPKAIFEKLLERGVLIRNVGIPNSLRLTAGTEPETTKLIAELGLLLD